MTYPIWNSVLFVFLEGANIMGITICLVSTVLGAMRWPGNFKIVCRNHALVFFTNTAPH